MINSHQIHIVQLLTLSRSFQQSIAPKKGFNSPLPDTTITQNTSCHFFEAMEVLGAIFKGPTSPELEQKVQFFPSPVSHICFLHLVSSLLCFVYNPSFLGLRCLTVIVFPAVFEMADAFSRYMIDKYKLL